MFHVDRKEENVEPPSFLVHTDPISGELTIDKQPASKRKRKKNSKSNPLHIIIIINSFQDVRLLFHLFNFVRFKKSSGE